MNSNVNWQLRIRNDVHKILKKFPIQDREKILDVVYGLVSDPYAGDIEKTGKERNVWRRRVGAYRVFYELLAKGKIIWVFHVKRRTSTTY